MLIAAAVFFVVAVLVAARITKRSLTAMTNDEKAKLVDVAARTPVLGFLVMATLAGGFVAVIALRPQFLSTATCVTLACVLIVIAASNFATYRRCRMAGLPQAFLRDFAIARSLRFVGAAALFAAAAVWLVRLSSHVG